MGEKNLWFVKFLLLYINYNQLYFVLRLNNCYGWPAIGQNRTRRSSYTCVDGGRVLKFSFQVYFLYEFII